jgi:thiol-disulfide isomerase/thioredoxin
LILALAGVLALGAGFFFGGFADDRNVTDLRGKDAGALFGVALPDTMGREQSIGQWKGKVLVVNFWATWCAPCREELPALARLQGELADLGLLVVAVSVDARPELAARFARERGLAFPVLGDPRQQVARRFDVRAYPTTVVIDRAGRVAQRAVGAFAWDAPETVAWLRRLLAEPQD